MVPTSSLSVSLFLAVYYAYVLPTHSFSLQALNSQTKSYDCYNKQELSSRFQLNLASSDDDETPFTDGKSNTNYINGLLQNLSALSDQYIMTGTMESKTKAYNIMKQIEREAMDDTLVQQGKRMVKRSGISMDTPPEGIKKDVANDDTPERTKTASQRKKWENDNNEKGRSALSQREARNGKPDVFMSNVMDEEKTDKVFEPTVIGTKRKVGTTMSKVEKHADDKTKLEKEMGGKSSGHYVNTKVRNQKAKEILTSQKKEDLVDEMNSELVARAGSGAAFDGKTLGIGGLDDVLSQVKRRVWVPLAAPPKLLKELGIHPVRGLLLYGLPGCGKTLLARSLGEILSPARPITVVSGPEIMDRFVGSSEANLRQIFDEPPDIYDTYRLGKDKGDSLAKKTLHVIVLDEFDAIARTRGGKDGGGSQGDAGVARDSVVNQLLAKMDGVDALKVPTLIIGLTNKRTLIEPALLRPGRFEVQIEVPPPRTVAQRVSILKVHTNHMYQSGRVLVKNTQPETAAHNEVKKMEKEGVDTSSIFDYEGLLEHLATGTDGMSGASLAGVARAAASRALERAVFDMSDHMEDCLVTQDDFEKAIRDVMESARAGDGGDIIEEDEEDVEDKVEEDNVENEDEEEDVEDKVEEDDIEDETEDVEVKAEDIIIKGEKDFTIKAEEDYIIKGEEDFIIKGEKDFIIKGEKDFIIKGEKDSTNKAVGKKNVQQQKKWIVETEKKQIKAETVENKKPVKSDEKKIKPPKKGKPPPPPPKPQFKFNIH